MSPEAARAICAAIAFVAMLSVGVVPEWMAVISVLVAFEAGRWYGTADARLWDREREETQP